ncbi:MAG: hypothetical protein L6R38_006683 [Xanthoria sp. 2 TBL-2021]|nr:MAG: hypothetical protein L6R38_006683 [Xanthoria sp. 2 TBL-2021]
MSGFTHAAETPEVIHTPPAPGHRKDDVALEVAPGKGVQSEETIASPSPIDAIPTPRRRKTRLLSIVAIVVLAITLGLGLGLGLGLRQRENQDTKANATVSADPVPRLRQCTV